MSLVFSLLQKDYAVLAADSRHTRGDRSGGIYKNDHAIKTVEIERGKAVLGFAGHDFGETVVSRAKSTGLLDTGDTLLQIVERFCPFASGEYERQYGGRDARPSAEFMLTGWFQDFGGEHVATTYTLRLPERASYSPFEYPYRYFEVIGKSCHGALYSLHRFGNEELPLDSALRLTAFTLREVCEQDTSVGGPFQIYILKPGAKVVKESADQINALGRTAESLGEQFENLVLRKDGV